MSDYKEYEPDPRNHYDHDSDYDSDKENKFNYDTEYDSDYFTDSDIDSDIDSNSDYSYSDIEKKLKYMLRKPMTEDGGYHIKNIKNITNYFISKKKGEMQVKICVYLFRYICRPDCARILAFHGSFLKTTSDKLKQFKNYKQFKHIIAKFYNIYGL